VACEVADRLREIIGAADGGRVVLVERDQVVGPELGPGPRPEILAALDALGVERRLGAEVTEVTAGGVPGHHLADRTTLKPPAA
jgi:NADH dehydrogenase